MEKTKKPHGMQFSFYDSAENRAQNTYKLIYFFTSFMTAAFFAASFAAIAYTGETDLWGGLFRILTSPSKLVTDYFALGGLAGAFFNAAVCGLISNLVMLLSRAKPNASAFAAYMLVVAHGFYGLNFLNIWPPLAGVMLYCAVKKKRFADNVHVALFSTALGPFISDLVFRYTLNGSFAPDRVQITPLGIVLALLFGAAAGFIVPALLPGTAAMHRDYNMYRAGLAIGIFGIFAYSLMYRTLGIEAPDPIAIDNPAYYALPYAYRGFINVFLSLLFLSAILLGFFFNRRSICGYRALIRSTGYETDLLDRFGMPVCMINFGVYGFCILAYLNIIFVLPEFFPSLPSGVGFTGPTVGVVFAALTFSADGQHPRNVAPIVLGYIALFASVCAVCAASGLDIPWSLSTQTYINGLAFATGLCAFSGKYGAKVGVLAGFLSAVICTSTSAMHGGFVLYNGGFTAGLTALVLLPILDFYNAEPKLND